MKKNRILKLGLLALALTLVTASLVSGTFAKYVTTVTGTGTVEVAHWVANFAGVTGSSVTQDTSFDLIGTLSDTGVDGNLLAPGTVGSFALKFDTDGAEVARNVTITLDASAPMAALGYLKFYKDALRATEITGTDGVYEIHNLDYAATAAGTEETVTVYWAWEFYSGSTATDAADTVDGLAGATYNVVATFVATQLDTL